MSCRQRVAATLLTPKHRIDMTGETFQNMRIELGKTQDEMADMLSVNVRTVQRIESTETVPHRYALAIGRVTTNEQQPETETP